MLGVGVVVDLNWGGGYPPSRVDGYGVGEESGLPFWLLRGVAVRRRGPRQ